MRFLILAMDGINDAALREGARLLKRDQGIDVHLDFYHAATMHGDATWARLAADAARADFIFGCMLFKEEIVRPLEAILGPLETPTCVITSNPAMIRCTRLGKFVLKPKEEAESPGLLQKWMSKFRPKSGSGESERQTALLRNMGKILRMIPGKARDLHTYIVVHDFWLQSSPENLRRMLCLLIERYVPGYSGKLPVLDPIQFPSTGVYHPDAGQHFDKLAAYKQWRRQSGLPDGSKGSVGLLTWRTGLLSGHTEALDALIRAVEARGIEVRTAYSGGLDSRPAMRNFFTEAGGEGSDVDLVVNGTGFSLIGGPASSHPAESVRYPRSLM